MMAVGQPQFETPGRNEFRDNIRLLAEISLWQLWGSILTVVLAAGAIALTNLPVRGLLGLVCVVSGVALYEQRRRLKLVREAFPEQTASEPAAPGTQEDDSKPDPSPVSSVIADERCRRSERVPFEMPVEVHASRENGELAQEEAKTLWVNAHGALLTLSMPVEMGQSLRLVNPRTGQEIECRVCFQKQRLTGGNEVGVEFAAVAPTFWDVQASPTDWGPARVSPEKVGRTQVIPLTALHRDDIRRLSDDVGMAFRGSNSAEWNLRWSPRLEPEKKAVPRDRRNGHASAPSNAEERENSPEDAVLAKVPRKRSSKLFILGLTFFAALINWGSWNV